MNPAARVRSKVWHVLEAARLYGIERQFVLQAIGGRDTRTLRRDLVKRFAKAHRNLTCAHQEAEALILAAEILRAPIDGPVVELGCFKGGSTAKLSLVCEATERTLFVCDSFGGLPRPKDFDLTHHCVSGRVKHYREGDYLGTLDEVRANVAAWGSIGACRFVKGYFAETLPTLDLRPVLIFMDVDLIESARQCVRYLWPRLVRGGKFYTHEASASTFVRGLMDSEWWHKEFGCCPPILIGAGYGHGSHAANLAYLEKED